MRVVLTIIGLLMLCGCNTNTDTKSYPKIARTATWEAYAINDTTILLVPTGSESSEPKIIKITD